MFENMNIFGEKNINEIYIKYSRKKKKNFIKNNNDTLNIAYSMLLSFNQFIKSIYYIVISFIKSLHQCLLKYIFSFILIFMLFNFVSTFESNSNISTNLIISAYFRNKPITRITLNMNEKNEDEKGVSNKRYININYDDYEKLIKDLNKNRDKNIDDFISCNNSSFYGDISNNNNKNKIIEDSSKEAIIKNKYQKNYISKWNSFLSNKTVEYYLFYYKTLKIILISIISFSYFFLFIKFTIYSKIKNSFIFNFICTLLNFNFLYISYQNEYYFSSNLYFALLLYNNKCLIESIYIFLKYRRKDFEIFSTSLMAFNSLQFQLKIILLLNLTILSGILSMAFYQSCLNYILFYICFFTLVVFLCNCIELIISFPYKPFKNIIIFFVGITNLFVSKVFLDLAINKLCLIFNINKNIFFRKDKNDSLYFISDLFSLFCLSCIKGYLDFQLEFNLVINNFIGNSEKNEKFLFKKLEKIIVWSFLFTTCFLICILSIYKKEKICLFMGIYLFKILLSYFSNLFSIQFSRFLYYIITYILLIFNNEFSYEDDNFYLINLFYSITGVDRSILSDSFNIFISAYLYYFIITINLNISTVNTEKSKYLKIMKKLENELNHKAISNVEPKNKANDKIKICYNYFIFYLDLFCNFLIICLLIAIYQYYEEIILNKFFIAITIAFIGGSKVI